MQESNPDQDLSASARITDAVDCPKLRGIPRNSHGFGLCCHGGFYWSECVQWHLL